jgi:hypothetical protein
VPSFHWNFATDDGQDILIQRGGQKTYYRSLIGFLSVETTAHAGKPLRELTDPGRIGSILKGVCADRIAAPERADGHAEIHPEPIIVHHIGSARATAAVRQFDQAEKSAAWARRIIKIDVRRPQPAGISRLLRLVEPTSLDMPPGPQGAKELTGIMGVDVPEEYVYPEFAA